VWMFVARYGAWWLARIKWRNVAPPDARQTFVVGWAGMRGVVSLATALALPRSTPERDLLIFVTFCVILATLVGQGLTLPLIIRALGLGVTGDRVADESDELRARSAAEGAAVARIEELADEWPTHLPLIDALRAQYGHRATHLGNHTSDQDGLTADGASAAEQELVEHRKIRRAVIDAERSAVLDLRDRGLIGDEAWRRVERDLDLEELRMEA
jgi:NhaP-type Na+/H+ or K+/H+ antiporter